MDKLKVVNWERVMEQNWGYEKDNRKVYLME
jgi:hypothetical protein